MKEIRKFPPSPVPQASLLRPPLLPSIPAAVVVINEATLAKFADGFIRLPRKTLHFSARDI